MYPKGIEIDNLFPMSQPLNHTGCVHPGRKNQSSTWAWRPRAQYGKFHIYVPIQTACYVVRVCVENRCVSTLSLSLFGSSNAMCVLRGIRSSPQGGLWRRRIQPCQWEDRGWTSSPSALPQSSLPSCSLLIQPMLTLKPDGKEKDRDVHALNDILVL